MTLYVTLGIVSRIGLTFGETSIGVSLPWYAMLLVSLFCYIIIRNGIRRTFARR